MKKTINLILAILTAVIYISVIIMKAFTSINIVDSSFTIISMLFTISEILFINSLRK